MVASQDIVWTKASDAIDPFYKNIRFIHCALACLLASQAMAGTLIIEAFYRNIRFIHCALARLLASQALAGTLDREPGTLNLNGTRPCPKP